MNIFYLDKNPKTCAEQHCNKHVVKMILEYAQILSTTHRLLDGIKTVDIKPSGKVGVKYVMENLLLEELLYKTTHQNHPSTVWVRQSSQHYEWLYELFVCLLNEYTHRYGKIHKTARLVPALEKPPSNLADNGWSDITLAMPDAFKGEDAVASYRNYYKFGKSELLAYKNREAPDWVLV
jgi:hypothetical protein